MIYPPTYPPHKTEHAEEQVYHMLKTLDPDRYDVFYDRRFAQMRPGERKDYQVDFLIADLGGGRFNALLVLEVKGGIVKYNGQQNYWTKEQRESLDNTIEEYKNLTEEEKKQRTFSLDQANLDFGI